MAMAVFRREGRRLLPSIAARPIAAIGSPLSSDKEEGLLGVCSFSSSVKPKSVNLVDTLEMVKALESKSIPTVQAEALTSAITGGLESLMQKLDADINNLEENQSSLIGEEVRKLRVEIENMKIEFVQFNAQQRCDQDSLIHKVKEELLKGPCELRSDYNRLRVDFETAKYEGVKYAIFTLAAVAAAGLGVFYLTT